MKSEWKIMRADEFCAFVTDGTHDSPKAKTTGRKLITSKHLKGFYIDFSTANYISEEDYNKIVARSSVEQWDILYSMIGTVGTTYLEKNPVVDYACKNMGIFKFSGRCDDAYWMYYYLKSPQAIEYVHSHLRGSTQAYVPLGTLREMPVLVPEQAVRKKIVSILKSLDDKIALNNKIIDNLERQAQAIYHSLFTSFDGVPENQLYDTELGLIPVGWTIKSLSEVTTPIRTKVKENDYKVLSAINTGQLQLSEEYFNKQVFSKNINNYIVVEPYDFAYNPARINIGSIGMNRLGFTGCVSPVYVVIRTEPNYHYFLEFFIKTKRFSEEVKTRASGSVRQSLSYADFGQIKIVYPPIGVVKQFNLEYVSRLKIIEHLKVENEKLSSIRDTLLPKLISGEIDVSGIQL